jgi:hypothetical protein
MAGAFVREVAEWDGGWSRVQRSSALFIVIVMLAIAGCGPRSDRLEVTGNVVLDGAPLDQGSIRFTSASGEKLIASGAMIRNGEFTVPQEKGLTPGTYLVEISAPDTSGKLYVHPTAPGEPQLPPTARERIPAEYNSNSQQKVDVTADGENQFEFSIQTRASK